MRDRRRAETSASLRSTARHLTAERGLNGFTIEELCEEVGVSRRTFFNYFPSKERAVLGVPERLKEDDLADEFVRASGDLLDDLAALYLARWERMDLSPEEVPALMAAVDREPRLLPHMLGLAGEGEREDVLLVERREKLPAGSLRAEAAVQILGAALRSTAMETFSAHNTDPFPVIFQRRLAAFRAILEP